MEAVPALAVVDARFVAGDAAALSVAKTLSLSGSDFTVTDAATGAVVLRVDGVLFSLRRRCLLADADRRPVLTVQESVRATLDSPPLLSSLLPHRANLIGGGELRWVQAMVMNRRWKVFRGESTSRRDLLFTVVKPSAIQLWGSTKVSVFLASNDAEQASDFRVTGSYHDGACAVSLGDSDTVIAKASKATPLSPPCSNHFRHFIEHLVGVLLDLTQKLFRAQIDRRFSVASALLGKNAYSVTVNAGIDYAFIVALVVVLDEMHFQP